MKAKQKVIFYLIAWMLPLLLLALCEVALRSVNYGQSHALFVPAPKMPGYLQQNPKTIERFFPNLEFAPNIAPDTAYFSSEKPENGLRIVVMGGSTAAGFPYGRFASIAQLVQHQLKRANPDLDVQVISTAMSAINSFALLDFVPEIIELKPDAVLIYAGHNEYLGIMGAASNYSIFGSANLNRWHLKLKNLRLYQLLQSLLGGGGEKPIAQSRGTLMAQAASDIAIPYQGELYQAGLSQYRENIESVAQQLNDAGITTFISTLASNERGQEPFKSAEETLVEAVSSKVVFQQAKELLYQGEIQQAKLLFRKAKDLDLLRFRAASDINKTILELVNDYQLILVDGLTALEQASPYTIIGDELMTEHLHPNARGYHILSKAFSHSIVNHYLQKFRIDNKSSISTSTEGDFIPLHESDIAIANFKVSQLKNDFPFVPREQAQVIDFPEPNTIPQRIAKQRLDGQSWVSTQQQLLEYYQRTQQRLMAAVSAEMLFEAFPNQARAAYVTGQLYRQAQQSNLAHYHYRQAVKLEGNQLPYRFALAQSYFERQEFTKSKVQLDAVLELAPNNADAKQYLKLVEQKLKTQG